MLYFRCWINYNWNLWKRVTIWLRPICIITSQCNMFKSDMKLWYFGLKKRLKITTNIFSSFAIILIDYFEFVCDWNRKFHLRNLIGAPFLFRIDWNEHERKKKHDSILFVERWDLIHLQKRQENAIERNTVVGNSAQMKIIIENEFEIDEEKTNENNEWKKENSREPRNVVAVVVDRLATWNCCGYLRSVAVLFLCNQHNIR